MGTKVLNHEIRVDDVLEEALSLHGFHEAIGHAIGHDELQVLALIVVLEVVVVLISLDQAVGTFGADIKEKREVELVVVNLWIIGQAPVQLEITTLAKLLKAHRESVNLVSEHPIADPIQVAVQDLGAKHVVSGLNHVLAKVEVLSVEELREGIWMLQL